MKIAAIIFDLQQHDRHIDAGESHPHSLRVIGDDNRPALEWTLETLNQFGVNDVIYLGDYHIEKVMTHFPNLKVRFVQAQGVAPELDLIDGTHPRDMSLLLIRAGTILLPGSLAQLCKGQASYAVDGKGKALGAYFLSGSLAGQGIAALRVKVPRRDVSLHNFFEQAIAAEPISLDGLAAPVTDQLAVASSIFRGKAQTLDNLAPLLKDAVFLPRERVRLSEWRSHRLKIIARIQASFGPQAVVVRSSVVGEDGLTRSQAGKYLSILGVQSGDTSQIERAIDEVIASYGATTNDDDEVLVQPQVQSVKASGVLLTRDPRFGGPYFVINEDRTSGRSDSVTAGDTNAIVQRFIAWSAKEDIDAETGRLLGLARDLVRLSRLDALDIEYIIDRAGRIYLLQVRPLAAAKKSSSVADSDILNMVAGAREFIEDRARPLAGLLGDTTILGVMPDWNPAEMIGLSPRPLALSLYQKLIGETAWSEARARLGYRNVAPEPLILSLGGRPYVDVRASLNSFLPVGLDNDIGARWINVCLERLRQDRALHDKIEFDLAITCLAPDWPLVQKRLSSAGIDPEDFGRPLRQMTDSILRQEAEPIELQFVRLGEMANRRQHILAEQEPGFYGRSRQLARLLDDCRQYGLVSFSILARYAFISMSFLKGFLQTGAISPKQYDDYLRALPTVASQFTDDLQAELPVAVLIERYGHLRPNSYEITAGNYASEPARYLRSRGNSTDEKRHTNSAATMAGSHERISASLKELGLDVGVMPLLDFIEKSIAGREQAKFEFMKNLNAALEIAALLGEDLGMTRDQVSFLSISDLLRSNTDSILSADRKQMLRRVAYNEKRWAVTSVMHLPDVVVEPGDVEAFALESWRANFITSKRVVGKPVWVDDETSATLDGAIVIIRAADPGYDWIFAHAIAGLVTEFGGVASHMSIRAAEFGLPAAIGCGSVVLESLRGAELVELDCAAEKVRPA